MRGITCLLTYLLLLGTCLQAQTVSYLETEIKLNPELQKLAGTVRVDARGDLTERLWRVPQGLTVDRVLLNGRETSYSRLPGGIALRENGPDQRLNRVEVIFYGSPAAAHFFTDESGLPWIELADTPDHFWHPAIPSSWTLPDSMWLSVILPPKLRPAGTLRALRTSSWPGGDQKWTFSQPTVLRIPSISIGNYVHFSNLQRTQAGTTEWTYWVPGSRLVSAETHYAEAPAMVSRFESLWGPIPEAEQHTWIERPGRSAIDRIIYPRTEPGYSQSLLYQTASMWLGDPALSSNSSIRMALYQYAELSWIEWKYPEAIFSRFLESYRVTPSFWGGWLLHYEAQTNPTRWAQALPELMRLARDPLVTDAALRAFLIDEVDPGFEYVLEQFLDIQVLPLLETRLEKKRNRWTMSYRYAGVQPGFEWPVELVHRGNIIELHPTNEWQNFVWPKGGGKSYHIDESQGLFEIRSR